MRTVYDASNVTDAHLVRQALERAGILSLVRGEAMLGGISELPPIGPVAVAAPESEWGQVHGVVESRGFGSQGVDQNQAIEGWGAECLP
ncbi:MAG: DUF2007 domain-containing protein [Thermomonas sp.]